MPRSTVCLIVAALITTPAWLLPSGTIPTAGYCAMLAASIGLALLAGAFFALDRR